MTEVEHVADLAYITSSGKGSAFFFVDGLVLMALGSFGHCFQPCCMNIGVGRETLRKSHCGSASASILEASQADSKMTWRTTVFLNGRRRDALLSLFYFFLRASKAVMLSKHHVSSGGKARTKDFPFQAC